MGLLARVTRRMFRSTGGIAPATAESMREDAYTGFVEDLQASSAYDGPQEGEYTTRSGTSPAPGAVRAIAFYLPQFHPIPENDIHWGEGFTEWTNTTKALPQFEGHYQPRLADALGYYDLRLAETQVRQAALARLYGIGGFCYHYYWFAGRRVMNRPIEQMLANPAIDLPFCLSWANEPWTRAWDGRSQEVIIPYVSEPETDRRFIDDVMPFLKDPRYLRVNGKPLLVVYRAARLKNAAATLDHWRARAREEGLAGLYIVCALTYNTAEPLEYGVDAAVEFPPHGLVARDRTPDYPKHNAHFAGSIFDYAETVEAESVRKTDAFTRIRTVFPAWDNEARAPGRGTCFTGSTPALYRRWLSFALAEARRDPRGPGLVFVNAWNEWAEGAYLEPDRRFGFAYLDATRAALAGIASSDA